VSPTFCRELFVRLTAKYHFADGREENSRQKKAQGKIGIRREPQGRLTAK